MKRLLALIVLVITGCVSQGTHDALRAELEGTRTQLAERDATLLQKEQALKDLSLEESQLRSALAAEQERSQGLSERIQKLEGDLANLLASKSSLESSVTEMKDALSELQRRKEEADARLGEYRALLTKFRSLIDAGKLKVRIQEGRMVVVLASDVLFASGSATVSKEGKTSLAEVAQLLASIPRRQFQVEGHTDDVPIATAQYPSNWELASARALAVTKSMVEAGMPHDRISAASFGDSKPAVPNDTPEHRAQNRRIEIIIVPDLSTLPGFDELNRLEPGT